MAWGDLHPELRQVIERVCTRREIELLALIADGYTLRSAAKVMGITRGAAQMYRRRAEHRIRREVAAQRGYDADRRNLCQ